MTKRLQELASCIKNSSDDDTRYRLVAQGTDLCLLGTSDHNDFQFAMVMPMKNANAAFFDFIDKLMSSDGCDHDLPINVSFAFNDQGARCFGSMPLRWEHGSISARQHAH